VKPVTRVETRGLAGLDAKPALCALAAGLKAASTAGGITGIHSEYWLGYKQQTYGANYQNSDGLVSLPIQYPSNSNPFSHWCARCARLALCVQPSLLITGRQLTGLALIIHPNGRAALLQVPGGVPERHNHHLQHAAQLRGCQPVLQVVRLLRRLGHHGLRQPHQQLPVHQLRRALLLEVLPLHRHHLAQLHLQDQRRQHALLPASQPAAAAAAAAAAACAACAPLVRARQQRHLLLHLQYQHLLLVRRHADQQGCR
jgi:hypothetical protein